MALLNCPECGNAVSEKSELCPVCGCPIAEIVKQNNEAKKETSKKWKTKLITLCAFIVIIGGAVALVSYLNSGLDPDGYYDGIVWNTSYDDVKAQLGKDDLIEDDDNKEGIIEKVDNIYGIRGAEGTVSYQFENNRLKTIMIQPDVDSGSDISGDDYVDIVTDKMTKAYGDYVEEDIAGIITRTWNTEKSSIDLWVFDADTGLLHITYSAKN